jgi:hypothetical protein
MRLDKIAIVVDDYDQAIRFSTEPRDEPYGRVAIFLDISGNRWDLIGPAMPH